MNSFFNLQDFMAYSFLFFIDYFLIIIFREFV